MTRAIDALSAALRAAPFAAAPQRLHLEEDGRTFLAMPILADGWAGAKLVTIVPDNPERGLPLVSATYTLFGPPGLEPLATIDGAALTDLRTAAVSGLATQHLARPGSSRLVVIGAGAQARAHVLAMAAVAPLRDVAVVARRPEALGALVEHVRDHGLDVRVRPAGSEDLVRADLICACTTGVTPVLGLADLAEGVHVNAIGAYRPDLAELEAAAVGACRVVVETREAALTEKGDLLQAEAAGTWGRADIVADLAELVSGRAPGRTAPDQRTLFASVGHAYEDLVVARAIHEAAGASA
ncbi:MAG: hypothetical protein RLZZ272_1485 [Actinomycetota bacterium]